MRTVRKATSMFYLKEVVISWLVLYMALLLPSQIVMAATPVCTDAGGAAVVQGANTTTITVNQPETIMKWSNFNTASGESVAFQQGSLSNAAVLNRISGSATQFDGDLSGPGMRIFLLNPSGIVFGSGSSVNVGQLVASSLNITDSDFLNGAPYMFTDGINAGDIVNEGSISAERIALIGRNITNRGILMADRSVVLAAGNTVQISETGGKVIVDIPVPNPDSLVNNEGLNGISVEGTDVQVYLGAGDIWSSAYIYAEGWRTASAELSAERDIGITNSVEVFAYGGEAGDATASIDVSAGGNVVITGIGEEAGLAAEAEWGDINIAQITVNAGGDVYINAGYEGQAYICSEAYDGNINNSSVKVNAGGSVQVIAEEGGAYAELAAYAEDAYGGTQNPAGNLASVDITANNVEVWAIGDSDARIKARAAYAYSYDEEFYADGIRPMQEFEIEPDGSFNTAKVEIHTFKTEMETPVFDDSLRIYNPEDSGGGHVEAYATNGGNAQIEAVTFGSEYESFPVNNSSVLICAEGKVLTEAANYQEYQGYEQGSTAKISSLAHFGFENNASLGIGAKQGIDVQAWKDQSNSSISSIAMSGNINNAHLVACTAGPVSVQAYQDADASIVSKAYDGHRNNAYTGVCADSLVEVEGDYFGRSQIASYAGISGFDLPLPAAVKRAIDIDEHLTASIAETVVVSKNSGVAVMASDGGMAGISSTAANAIVNDAYTGVCAKDHILTTAGAENLFYDGYYDDYQPANGFGGSGGTAYISSDALSSPFYTTFAAAEEPLGWDSSSNAKTDVVSRQGAVAVIDRTGNGYYGSASISSFASGSEVNTSYTGVAAGADLSPASLDAEIQYPDREPASFTEQIEWNYRYGLPFHPGEVVVSAEGPYSSAVIESGAFAPYSILSDAQTVICAPGAVSVESYGGEGTSWAEIRSYASSYEGTAKSDTQIYTSQVYLSKGYSAESAISAEANSERVAVRLDEEYTWSWTADSSEPILRTGEEQTTLIIDSYANRQDCPDCPPCPDCPCQEQEEGMFAPVAPLAKFELPRIEGCPVLTQATANELEIAADTLQVAIGNALALNPNIQPCQACSNLINAAAILQDADGSRMAAMAYVFSQIAPADAPFTPEMGAVIATAFSQNAQTDARYASAMEYVDAFVRYVTVVDRDLNAPVEGGAVALVMNKYGSALIDSPNSNIAAYIMTQIQQ